MLASDTDEGGTSDDRDGLDAPAASEQAWDDDESMALIEAELERWSSSESSLSSDVAALSEGRRESGEPAPGASEGSGPSDGDASAALIDDLATSVVLQREERNDDTDSDSEFAALQLSMSQLLNGAPVGSLGGDTQPGSTPLADDLRASPPTAATAGRTATVQKAEDDPRTYLAAADSASRSTTAAEINVVGAIDSDSDDIETSLHTLMELVCADDTFDSAHAAPSRFLQYDSSPKQQLATTDRDPIAETSTRRFCVAQETPYREVILDIMPHGIAVTHGDDSVTFIHLLAMLSWHVHRTSVGQAIGFCIVTADQDRHKVFLTRDGLEICALLLMHVQNLEATATDGQRDGLHLVPATRHPMSAESIAEEVAWLKIEMEDRSNSLVAEMQAGAQLELAKQRVELQAQVGMMEVSIKAALAEASATEEKLHLEVEALEDQVSEEAQRRQKAEQERDAEIQLAAQQQALLQAELDAWAQVQAVQQEATAAKIAEAEAAALEFDRVMRESPPVGKASPRGHADHMLVGDIDVSGTWNSIGSHGGTSIKTSFALTQDKERKRPHTVKELQGLLLEVQNVEDLLRIVTSAGVLPAAIEWARGQAHTRNAALQLMAAHLARNPPASFSGKCAESADDEDATPYFCIVNGIVLRSALGEPSVCFTQRFEEDEWSTGGDVFWAGNLCFSDDELGLTGGRWAGMGMNGGSWSGNRLPLEWPEEWDGCLNGERTALDMENWAVSDAELSQLSAMLPRLRNLQIINLSGNEITSLGPLADGLLALPRLKKLLLTVNLIIDIAPLVAVLPRLPCLKQLLLDGNMIADISNLHQVLPKLRSLQMLDLSDNRIGIRARDLIERAFRGTNLFLEPQMARGVDRWLLTSVDVPEAKGHSGSEASAVCSPQKAAPVLRPKLGQRLYRPPSKTGPVPDLATNVSTGAVAKRMGFDTAVYDHKPVLLSISEDTGNSATVSRSLEVRDLVEEAIPPVAGAPTRTSEQHQAHMRQHLTDCVARWQTEHSELKAHLTRHEAGLITSRSPPEPEPGREPLPEAESHSGQDRHAVVAPRKATPLHRPRRRDTSSPQRLAAVVGVARFTSLATGQPKQPVGSPSALTLKRPDPDGWQQAMPGVQPEEFHIDTKVMPGATGTDRTVPDTLLKLESARNVDSARLAAQVPQQVSALQSQMEQRILAVESEAVRQAAEAAAADHEAALTRMEKEIQALRKQLESRQGTTTAHTPEAGGAIDSGTICTGSEATPRRGHAEELRQLSLDTAATLTSNGALASARAEQPPMMQARTTREAQVRQLRHQANNLSSSASLHHLAHEVAQLAGAGGSAAVQQAQVDRPQTDPAYLPREFSQAIDEADALLRG